MIHTVVPPVGNRLQLVSLTPMSPVGFFGHIELHMVWDCNIFMGLNNFSHGMGIEQFQLLVNNQVVISWD